MPWDESGTRPTPAPRHRPGASGRPHRDRGRPATYWVVPERRPPFRRWRTGRRARKDGWYGDGTSSCGIDTARGSCPAMGTSPWAGGPGALLDERAVVTDRSRRALPGRDVPAAAATCAQRRRIRRRSRYCPLPRVVPSTTRYDPFLGRLPDQDDASSPSPALGSAVPATAKPPSFLTVRQPGR